MLSSLRRIISQTTSFNRGNSATINLLPVLYNQKNPSLFIGIIRFSSSSPPKHDESSSSSSSFVLNYLINSCGLSEHHAIKASRKLNFTTSSNPDSVLDLLENYGFTKPYITELITKQPSFLTYNPLKILKPKLDFFISIGISGIDLAKFASSNNGVLKASLQGKLIPTYDNLKKLVHRDENAVAIIKANSWILTGNLIPLVMVNIQTLGDAGVPRPKIVKFLISQPRVFTISTGRLKEIVKEIKGLGIDPYKNTYLHVIKIFTRMSNSNRESKLDVYRRFGWSEEEICKAFRSYPQCILRSEKKITSVMDYLVNQMGYDTSFIAKWPNIFTYSLEKRIMPRCSVYKILTSKGLVKNPVSLFTLIQMSEKSFLEKFVIKFVVEAPELLKLYPSAVKSRAA